MFKGAASHRSFFVRKYCISHQFAGLRNYYRCTAVTKTPLSVFLKLAGSAA